jgi:hypothetical protein
VTPHRICAMYSRIAAAGGMERREAGRSHTHTHTARVSGSVDPGRNRLLVQVPSVMRTRHAERRATSPS